MFPFFDPPAPFSDEALNREMDQFIAGGLRQLETYLRTYADWQDFLRRREAA